MLNAHQLRSAEWTVSDPNGMYTTAASEWTAVPPANPALRHTFMRRMENEWHSKPMTAAFEFHIADERLASGIYRVSLIRKLRTSRALSDYLVIATDSGTRIEPQAQFQTNPSFSFFSSAVLFGDRTWRAAGAVIAVVGLFRLVHNRPQPVLT